MKKSKNKQIDEIVRMLIRAAKCIKDQPLANSKDELLKQNTATAYIRIFSELFNNLEYKISNLDFIEKNTRLIALLVEDLA